jgi:peptide chain release factor subunit 1
MKNDYSIYKEIKRLKSIRGAGTEMISIYIPAGMQISEETNRLREEHSQSSNIKSKSTKVNVQMAIEKIIHYLKLFKETPKNGLAVFCGNISENSGKTEIELFSIEPPFPIMVNIYRCDSTFLLSPIEDVVEAKETFCLIAMDGREATIATLKGASINVIKKVTSMAHAKVRKGGQSARRYERAIEESIDDYYKEVGDAINAIFAQEQFKITGLVVGGPGPAKEGFVKINVLNYQIKVLGVFDTGYTNEYGLHELLEKARDLLKEQDAAKERKTLERFMQEIARGGLVTSGYENTKKALLAKQVAKLIINKDIDRYIIGYKCNTCGKEISKIEEGKNRAQKHNAGIDSSMSEGGQTCGGTMVVVSANDIVEELIGIAEDTGAEMEFVSSEGSYEKEFLMGFTGIGAILRYK